MPVFLTPKPGLTGGQGSAPQKHCRHRGLPHIFHQVGSHFIHPCTASFNIHKHTWGMQGGPLLTKEKTDFPTALGW